MTKHPNGPKGPRTKIRVLDGPIQPKSPLYRALEMIAHEIAKNLEGVTPLEDKRQDETRR
jgi:hypothetical protein